MVHPRALALLCAAALAACSQEPEPQRPFHDPSKYDYSPAPAPAAAEVKPQAPDPAVLAKLEPLAAAANAVGAAYGLSFSAEDFVKAYERHRREHSETRSPHDAKLAGLPEPEIVPFQAGELEKGPLARWTDGGGVQYGRALPRDGAAVTEAWSRVSGFRDLSVPGVMMTQSGVLAEKWRRTLWQPNKKRWAFFTEEQERAILAAMVSGPLSRPDPDSKNSARFECERLQRAVDAAAGKEHLIKGYRGTMKAAVLRSYDPELELLAAQSLLE